MHANARQPSSYTQAEHDARPRASAWLVQRVCPAGVRYLLPDNGWTDDPARARRSTSEAHARHLAVVADVAAILPPGTCRPIEYTWIYPMNTKPKLPLNKTQILSADPDLGREWVAVPEWKPPDGDPDCDYGVWVRELPAELRDSYEASLIGDGKGRNMKNVRARLCALAIVDEAGQPLLTAADVEALGRRSCRAVDRIFGVAKRLSALSAEDEQEILGNSAATAAADAA